MSACHFLGVPNSNVTLTANGTGALNKLFSLICRLNPPESLVGFSINLTIEKMINGVYEVVANSSITRVEFSLSPLTTSDAGMYRCLLDLRQDVISYQETFEDLLTVSVISKRTKLFNTSMLQCLSSIDTLVAACDCCFLFALHIIALV